MTAKTSPRSATATALLVPRPRPSHDELTPGHAGGQALPDYLEEPLLKLKLNHARAACPELLASAKAEAWTHEEFLRRFLNEEMMGVDEARRAARVRAARFARTPSRSPPGSQNSLPSTSTSKKR